MALHSPIFREVNYGRITTLREHFTDATVARIVSEHTGSKVSASDIRGYVKLNKVGSRRMLVSSTVIKEMTGTSRGADDFLHGGGPTQVA
ncbi:hypothetical protein [Luteibacter sp. dw_328]|uniref:hypothetical protein n=1 Tax=Luteibacter sp. dw_328 TaxID=2719796 RepID=UPI001BD565F1|nr:hypothetical protein [Luteibacter sp. dw_328]